MVASLLFKTLLTTALAQAPGTTETVHSQPAWILQNGNVKLAITHIGGQMAPVQFYRDGAKPIAPYYISPWQDEGLKLEPPVLTSLRGNFLAFPFGSNAGAYKGMKFLPHGEPAGAKWSFVGAKKQGKVTSLALSLKTGVPSGTISKRVQIVDGQNVVYSQDLLQGYSLRASVGHHAILAVPNKEGALKVATSEMRYGRVSPFLFSNPVNGEYQSMEIGKRFSSLTKIPLAWKDSKPTDASAFPARRGFADLLGVFSKPAASLPHGIAWTTATNDDAGYLWFSMRNPSILPTTVFWIENHGRHGSPWNGRNQCLGLEDVCSYLNEGMPISAQPNDINADGIPTSIQLNAKRPTAVNYVEGVAKIPKGFVKVRTIEFAKGKATFVSITGKRVTVPVNWDFVQSGKL